jgi:hypothetical protein
MDASKSSLAAKDRMALRELACMWAQELGVTPDDAAPGGFLAHSFAGDDPIVCKDFARQKLGLEPFKPNGEGRPRPPFPPKGEGLDFTIGERISMDETISLDDWEDVRAMIERKRAGRAGEPEPFNPADLDYFPPGEPWRNGPDARAPRKPGRGTLAQKNAEEGSGLGLPIVKGLIELHGGSFTLKSKLREGTEVIVVFPLERVIAAVPAVAEESAGSRNRSWLRREPAI